MAGHSAPGGYDEGVIEHALVLESLKSGGCRVIGRMSDP